MLRVCNSCSTRLAVALMFQRKRALILLDNCEHVIDAAASVAEHVFEACDAIRIVATSREPLGIAGEQVFSVRSLGLPVATAVPEPPTITMAGFATFLGLGIWARRRPLVIRDVSP